MAFDVSGEGTNGEHEERQGKATKECDKANVLPQRRDAIIPQRNTISVLIFNLFNKKRVERREDDAQHEESEHEPRNEVNPECAFEFFLLAGVCCEDARAGNVDRSE